VARRRIKVANAVRVETGAGSLSNPRWMDLLSHIEGGARSITSAAKATGLSYKAAWDAIDAMNNLAGEAVVTTTVGGRGGGGAQLTPYGRELLHTYRSVEAENDKYLKRVNARLGSGRHHLTTLDRWAMQTSARNQWAGKVMRVRRGAVNDEIEVSLTGGDRVVAIITQQSTTALDLRRGSDVVALVKASSVLIGLDWGGPLALSARNQLRGVVERITRGAVNSEVVVRLKGGNTVAAMVTNGAVETLRLELQEQVVAVFKASSVILGTT
jgi:molybdate transport system regulatory protein